MAIAAVPVRPRLRVHFSSMIDLRSDTVTKPTEGMLKAMMSAPLGDDVFREDPTVIALESKMAEMFGKEAGLFFPSGTMANQAAVMVHTSPGQEVICDANCHIYYYEQGGIARNSGCSVRLIEGNRGVITAQEVQNAIRADDVHFPVSSLVIVENSCNRGGGKVFPINELELISEVCSKSGMRLHVDGARLFNSIIADGSDPTKHGSLADSISICLSKGLGCPIGSVLVGNRDFIKEAHRVRKVLGGGMRQVGIMAAAGIYALDHHIERLKVDHERAKLIAGELEKMDFVDRILSPETNILVFEIRKDLKDVQVNEILQHHGLLCFIVGPNRFRFVFHLDITEKEFCSIPSILAKVADQIGAV